MAGLWATLNTDGTFAESTSSASLKNSHEEKGGTNIDSEAFLTLLVAEMQNQDPLEPTSNTEWISQYATFTEVSTIQEIGDSMSSVQAQGLTGKHVIMKVTDEKGQTNYIDGLVDRVAYEAGKAYLYINGNPYSIDDLDTVVSDEYINATEKIADLQERIGKLPEVRDVTTADEEEIMALGKILDGLTEYEKQFLEGDEYDTMTEYLTELNAVIAHQEALDRSGVIENAVANLPDLAKIDSWSEDQLKYAQAFVAAYDDLSQTEKGYVSDKTTQIVGQYKKALEALKDTAGTADNTTVSDAQAILQQAQEALAAAEQAKAEAQAAQQAAEEAREALTEAEMADALTADTDAEETSGNTSGTDSSSENTAAVGDAGSGTDAGAGEVAVTDTDAAEGAAGSETAESGAQEAAGTQTTDTAESGAQEAAGTQATDTAAAAESTDNGSSEGNAENGSGTDGN